jgi:tetratricopeptide (TPR) repeat protein
MPIGIAEKDELSELLTQVKGNDEAEEHISKVLSAVSGYGGMNNASAIMGEHVADSLKVAEILKTEGNRLFGEGNYDNALLMYQKAIDKFKEYSVAQLDSASRKLLVTCKSNSAQAFLKLASAEFEDSMDRTYIATGAREMADQALEMEPTNVKARFRRGCAYAMMQDYSSAKSDFEWTLRMEPGNDAAKRELRTVMKHLRDDRNSNSGSWEKAAAAAVKAGQCEDPRSNKPSEAAAQMPIARQVERQISMATQIRKGAAQHFEKKGHLDVWVMEEDNLQQQAELIAEQTEKKVAELEEEGKDLEAELGARAAPLSAMSKEQRSRYLAADAFITAMKETFPSDFNDIVQIASTL